MKNRVHTYILVFWFITLFLKNSTLLARSTFTVGWNTWAPHQYKDSNGKLSGINIELILKIMEYSGFKVIFKKIPWKRNLIGLKNGSVDIAMSAQKMPERQKYAYFSDTYFKLEYNVVIIRKKDIKKFSFIKSLKDIIGTKFRLGVTYNYIYSHEYSRLLKNKDFLKNIKTSNQIMHNVRRFILNQVDGLLEDELAGYYTLKKLGHKKDISILLYAYGEEGAKAYLMFSKKSMTKKQALKISESLRKIKLDGTYQKLLKKFVPNLN